MNIYEAVIEKYGVPSQLWKTIEELRELTVEVERWIRRDGDREALIHEIADVKNMLKQLEIMFDINGDKVAEIMDAKMIKAKCNKCIYDNPSDCEICDFGGMRSE
jgi:NTP pyrophosphatase (non-canonical NTP hydrolase)